MDIQKIQADRLLPSEYNPRKDLMPGDEEFEKLKRSISEFGYVEPIIWNKRTGNIVGGHQRFKVLLHLGYKEVDCVVLDIDEQKEKALNIALNKISGEWDMSMLKDLLLELDNGDFDVSITGFDLDEIEDIMLQLHQDADLEDDDFDADSEYESIAEPISRQGDIWYLGNHKVMCGDTTNSDDVEKLMGDEPAQLIVTDPPYNVNYFGTAGNIENDNMEKNEFYKFIFDAFQNMFDTAQAGAAMYVFHSDTEGDSFRKAFCETGFMLKQCLIWVKNSFVIGRQDYQWRHEPILYGWKGGAAHYFVNDRKQSTVFDDSPLPDFKRMKKDELLSFVTEYFDKLERMAQTVIYCDRPTKSVEHPTMKPLPLIGKLIANSSKPHWIVQDLFGGSGSTLIACEKLNRQSRLMEYDEKYTDVIVKRYIKLCKENGQEPKVVLARDSTKSEFDIALFEN